MSPCETPYIAIRALRSTDAIEAVRQNCLASAFSMFVPSRNHEPLIELVDNRMQGNTSNSPEVRSGPTAQKSVCIMLTFELNVNTFRVVTKNETLHDVDHSPHVRARGG